MKVTANFYHTPRTLNHSARGGHLSRTIAVRRFANVCNTAAQQHHNKDENNEENTTVHRFLLQGSA